MKEFQKFDFFLFSMWNDPQMNLELESASSNCPKFSFSAKSVTIIFWPLLLWNGIFKWAWPLILGWGTYLFWFHSSSLHKIWVLWANWGDLSTFSKIQSVYRTINTCKLYTGVCLTIIILTKSLIFCIGRMLVSMSLYFLHNVHLL